MDRNQVQPAPGWHIQRDAPGLPARRNSAASPNQAPSPPPTRPPTTRETDNKPVSTDSNPTTQCRYTTDIKVERFNFSWTIKNYSFGIKSRGRPLDSPTFCVGAKKETTWRLQVYPRGQDAASKEHLSLYLTLLASSLTEVRVKVKFFILVNGQKVHTMTSLDNEILSCNPGEQIGYMRFLRLENVNEQSGFMEGDNLSILCEGILSMNSVEVSGHSTRLPIQIPECALSEDFGSLFGSRKFSDVALSVNGKKLLVHKAVLAARSPVFAAMFEHDMQENQQNRVVITDVDYPVLRELMLYMYTGKSPNIEKMADDLLVAADKYDLGGLKGMCEVVLYAALTVDNAAELLEFADKYRAKQLRTQALYFIETYRTDVMASQAWKDMILKNPRLLVEEFGALSVSK